MRDAALGHFDAVLVYKLDRFGRSVRHCLDGVAALQAHGVRFLAVSQSIDPVTQAAMLLTGRAHHTQVARVSDNSARNARDNTGLNGAR